MGVIGEAFHLNQNNSNITEADGTANKWSDIWDYQVPTGIAHVLSPEHTFGIYLEDDSPAVVGDGTCQVRIEIRDVTENDKKVIFGAIQYVRVKEFQDSRKKAKLNLADDLEVKERSHIVIMAKDDGTIDASDSYFDLEMEQVRDTL